MRLWGNYCWKEQSEEPHAISVVTNILRAKFACQTQHKCSLRANLLKSRQNASIYTHTAQMHLKHNAYDIKVVFIKMVWCMLLWNSVWMIIHWLTLHHALKFLTSTLLFPVRSLTAAQQAVEAQSINYLVFLSFFALAKGVRTST